MPIETPVRWLTCEVKRNVRLPGPSRLETSTVSSVGVVCGMLGGLSLGSSYTVVQYNINFSVVTVVFVCLYPAPGLFQALWVVNWILSLETLDVKQSILKLYWLSHLN